MLPSSSTWGDSFSSSSSRMTSITSPRPSSSRQAITISSESGVLCEEPNLETKMNDIIIHVSHKLMTEGCQGDVWILLKKFHPPVTEKKHWWIQTVTKLLHPHLGCKNHLLLFDRFLITTIVWITIIIKGTSLYPRRFPSARQSRPSSPPSSNFATLCSVSIKTILLTLRLLKMCYDTCAAKWEVGALSTWGSAGVGGRFPPWKSLWLTISEKWGRVKVDVKHLG